MRPAFGITIKRRSSILPTRRPSMDSFPSLSQVPLEQVMKRRLALLAWAIVPILASESLAQTNDGYIGIYADAAGTLPCTTVPPLSGTTLYVIAKLEGASAGGISGAEFRIEVENPSGWQFSYTSPPA